MFNKDIEKTSKLTAIKISKRLDKISNTMYINYTTETGRIANCIYSNEEDDPLFNKDFLSACIYWGKRCTHPQNVAKWIEECLDRYNKIKRCYKEEV